MENWEARVDSLVYKKGELVGVVQFYKNDNNDYCDENPFACPIRFDAYIEGTEDDTYCEFYTLKEAVEYIEKQCK